MRWFMDNCPGARLHWGKAGWDWLQPCFDGAAHYEKWCDFGCAAQVSPLLSNGNSVLHGDISLEVQ